jgi:DNA-binding GntR family transcriptional regulator
MNRIAAGEYPVGSRLPKEIELSAAYRISRHTVREALRRLDQAGLLSRRRRAGTEVVASHPRQSYRQPINSITDLLQYAENTTIVVRRRHRVRCDAKLASLLGCEVGREWLMLESLRTALDDPRPICHTTMYLNLELEDIDKHAAELSGPVSAMIEEVYGLDISDIEQSIEAVPLDPARARLLREKPATPALKAIRRYYDRSGRLLELAIAIHPGERFNYVTRLHRDQRL